VGAWRGVMGASYKNISVFKACRLFGFHTKRKSMGGAQREEIKEKFSHQETKERD